MEPLGVSAAGGWHDVDGLSRDWSWVASFFLLLVETDSSKSTLSKLLSRRHGEVVVSGVTGCIAVIFHFEI